MGKWSLMNVSSVPEALIYWALERIKSRRVEVFLVTLVAVSMCCVRLLTFSKKSSFLYDSAVLFL